MPEMFITEMAVASSLKLCMHKHIFNHMIIRPQGIMFQTLLIMLFKIYPHHAHYYSFYVPHCYYYSIKLYQWLM